MKKINRIGMTYGRLTVIAESLKKTKRGEGYWVCQCSCGSQTEVCSSNLVSNKTMSCGCLAKEMSSARAKLLFTKLKTMCQVEGCTSDTSKGGNGFCGKHAQRVRRYGDPNYVTPESIRVHNLRLAHLSKELKPNTYRKFFGKHEHRVIAETMIGRALLPNEHVHHKDHNKHNNSPDNLEVMDSKDHAKLHAKERKHATKTISTKSN